MTTDKPSKASRGKKALHEVRELIVLTAYLYVAFSALIFFKFAILRGQEIGWAPWGLPFIKAVLVAKFVLLGRAFHTGERYRTKPLIWPTLHKSAIFLVIVAILTAIEEAVVGLFHGRTIWQSIAATGGSTPEKLATLLLVFLIFCPYFGIRSLGEALGEKSLIRLFFVDRQEFWAIKRPAEEN